MNPPEPSASIPDYAAFVSLDWADLEHAWALRPGATATVEQGVLKNTPEAVEQWARKLAQRFGGWPVAVALEQRRGAVIAMLTKYAHLVIYPIHPSTLAPSKTRAAARTQQRTSSFRPKDFSDNIEPLLARVFIPRCAIPQGAHERFTTGKAFIRPEPSPIPAIRCCNWNC